MNFVKYSRSRSAGEVMVRGTVLKRIASTSDAEGGTMVIG
jgi:hypothetical protein